MKYIFDNDLPIYIQVAEILRMNIISGVYKADTKLPSIRELAIAMRVNPNTILKALGELEQEKLIYTERTNGKFVTKNNDLIAKIKNKKAKEESVAYLEKMQKLGIKKEEVINYLNELEEK